MLMRRLEDSDQAAVRTMLEACGAFSDEEVRVALEIFASPEFTQFGAELDGRLVGYICLDRIELTRSTWHVYWLCVHPEAQRRGVATALDAYAAAYVQRVGGERLVVETSGRADYEGARRFYEKAGYIEVGRIADYYKPGDDCVYYCKVLG